MSNKNTIHINGKTYDAVTGALLSAPVGIVEPMAAIKHIKSEAPALKPHHAPHHTTNHTKPHAPSRSKSLMRQAVKKPGGHTKSQVVAHGMLQHQQPAMATIIKKRVVSDRRQSRAATASKSEFIKHFGAPASGPRTLHVSPPHKSTAFSHTVSNSIEHHAPHNQHAQPEPSSTDLLLEHALREATAHMNEPLKRSKKKHLFKLRRA